MNHIVKSKYWLYDPVYWINADYTVEKLVIQGIFISKKKDEVWPEVHYTMSGYPEDSIYCESELFASFDEAVEKAYNEKRETLCRRIDRECVIEDRDGNLCIYKNFKDFEKALKKKGLKVSKL